MNLRRLTMTSIGLLICILLVFVKVLVIDVQAATSKSGVSPKQQQILQSLTTSNIIYLGEIHDSASDHADQLTILQHLHQQKPQLAIGLEMFQKPYQPIIDRYLTGAISESELVQQTEYEKRWGWPWENYAPLLRWAKEQRVPVIALNTPTEVLRKVAKGGLSSLTAADFQYIPPIAEIDKSNLAYRDLIFASYQQHKAQALITSPEFDRFHTAQLLWDETMADTAAVFYQKNRRTQLVVIAGQAHIRYGHGIPSRVSRRLTKAKIAAIQKSVILSSDEPWDSSIGDFLFRPLMPANK
jgi:uncharacterized iron-regulated protein